jgi:lipoprotein NlpI
MGFYLGSGPERGLTEDVSPTITAREYVSALSCALTAMAEEPRGRCYHCRQGIRYLAGGLRGLAALVFAEHVERCPADEDAHRLLGLAHLSGGDLRAAVKHLEIALGLVRRKSARAIGLSEHLRLQCDAALLRLVLVRLHVKLD